MPHESLLLEIEEEGITLIELNFKGSAKGLYANKVIALSNKLQTEANKNSILVEELGHHFTSYGNVLDLSDIRNAKIERLARAWGYNRLIKVSDFIDAFKDGVRNRYELAEYLSVNEDFLEATIKYFSEKYGLYYKVGNFVIYFESLSFLEIWE